MEWQAGAVARMVGWLDRPTTVERIRLSSTI